MDEQVGCDLDDGGHDLCVMVLGTAQLGMRYGVANLSGQPDLTGVTGIVDAVWRRGVRFFDTAPAYGTSEVALGRALAELSIRSEARVITKFNMDRESRDPKAVLKCVEGSLRRLGVPRLWGLLLHDEDQLDQWDDSFRQVLVDIKRTGLVSFVGASVYSPERALQALAMEGLDLLQVPANVFDRRMERAGVFRRAGELGKTILLRSVYLQGLALMAPGRVPPAIPMAAEAVEALRKFCVDRGMDLRRFGIEHVRHMAPGALVVVGAETVDQAIENCSLVNGTMFDERVHGEWAERWPRDIDGLADPRLWRLSSGLH